MKELLCTNRINEGKHKGRDLSKIHRKYRSGGKEYHLINSYNAYLLGNKLTKIFYCNI